MKKALKNLLSVVLCVAVALSCLFVVSSADIKANAYYGSNYITAGETYNFVLTNVDRGVAYFIPQVSGFYNLTLTDYVRSGWIGMWINERDNTDGIYKYNFYNYNPEQIINSYISTPLYLRAGNEYQINVGYYAQSYNQTMTGGNMSIRFDRINYTPPLIPSSAAGSSQAIYNASQREQYFSYTTSQAGDYTLSYQQLRASVDVYRAADGITVYSRRDSEYWKSGEDGGYISGTKMVFKLEANTTYYFRMNSYYDYGSSPLFMNKNEKDVSHILVESADAPISCWLDELNICYQLNYRITYTDGSDDCMHSNDLQAAGYTLPEVTYGGKFIDIGYYRILGKGKQVPIHSEYDNRHSNTIYIEIISLTDELIAQGETAMDEFSVAQLTNFVDHSYDFVAFQRVKVLETGFYHIEPAQSSQWMDMDRLYPIILDSNNNEIIRNGTNESWALIGGQEYVLIVDYSFSYHSDYNDFYYELVRDRKNIFPDTASGQWYSDAIAYAYGSGIMTGYENGKFGTSDGIQRQDFLVMLARYDGVAFSSYAYANMGGFSDFNSYEYYAPAVNWGYYNDIVTGYQNGKFGVGDKITREQIVTFLYRYAKYKGLDVEVSTASANAIKAKYKDFGNVSDFSKEAVLWAIDRGVINGKTSNTIAPQGTAQRCEVAQIMYNIFCKDIF